MSRGIVLDVTRTLSPKSIATPTGIDRVERAYIEYLLNIESEVRFLCRNSVLNRDGMRGLFGNVLGSSDWGPRDLRAIGRGFKGQIEADIRRHSGADLPNDFIYLNVSHVNLESASKLGARQVIGYVHDMIPLDHPEFQTPASISRFEARMRALAGSASLIFTNSQFTADRTRHWFDLWGRSSRLIVNPIGISPLPMAPPIQSERPYFVVLGTIEPRKNHAMLLKIWESFQGIAEHERPVLHILGRRGWMNEEVFQVLDTSPMMGRDVIEHGTLSDHEVAAYLRGAHALLFPSFTEGYGLPLLEAASVNTRTIVSDIPVFRELADGLSLYLNPFDDTVWRKAIIEQTKQGITGRSSSERVPFNLPSWPDHFATFERHLDHLTG